MKKKIISLILCLVMTFAVINIYEKPVNAAATNKALKYLKGKWFSIGMYDGVPRNYAKFTKKYVKWYGYNPTNKKYEYLGKTKIVSTKKYKKGYIIKLKSKNGRKSCFRTRYNDKNLLDSFGTWNSKEFKNTYSGTDSLRRY